MTIYTTKKNHKDVTLRVENLPDNTQKVIIAAKNLEGKGGSHSIVLEPGVKVLIYREI